MARGTLRIFLGAAPGVGKTYEMLEEAHRLGERGEDVAVAYALDHGRADTRALMAGLEIIPPRPLSYRGAEFEEMDVDAVLARAPETAVVDEYAHSNVPGSRNQKRWQDVDELLSAGINVLSTVNIQHLASLSDVVSAITDVRQAETVPAEVVPDEVVRRADQIDLVDIPPELLRQRLTDGKIYAADKIDSALSNYFRLGNLSALRELALLWLADRVDEGLAKYRAEHGIQESWPARERIVVGLTGGPEGEALIRRGARIMTRVSGGDLLAVHVRAADGVASESPQALERQRRLMQDLGGSYHIVAGEDPSTALLDFARSVNATQIVVGISRHKNFASLLGGLLGGGVGTRVVRGSGDIDVHMVSHPLGGQGTGVPRPRDLGRARVAVGFVLAVLLPAFLQLLLTFVNPDHSVATAMLVQLSGSVAVALVGGLWPAVLAALWSSLLLNYFSTPPIGNLTISDAQNFLAIFVFLGVSAAVAVVVDLSARRSKEAARARAEATTLSDLTRGAAGSDDTVQALLEQARTVFQVRGTALFGQATDGDGTLRLLASAGEVPASGTAAGRGRQPRPRGREHRGDRLHHPAGPLRPDPAGQRQAAPRGVRRAPGSPAGAPAARGQPARNDAPGREQHHAHVHPPRGLPRSPDAPGRDQTRGRRPPAARGPVHPAGRAGTAGHDRGMLRPARRAGRQSPGHVPHHLRLGQPPAPSPPLVRGHPGRPARRPAGPSEG